LIEEKGLNGGSLPLLIKKEKEVENLTNNTKHGQLKNKLRMKVRGGNAFEKAGLKIRDTDVKNRGHQLRWFGVGTEPKGSKYSSNRELQGEKTNKPRNKQKNTETVT
jgi:hypothetical protein